ncbi:MAG: C13 family peptidase [Burkholderiales bacterium]
MRYALASLARNLGAGARLMLFLRVDRLAFRIDVAQLLLLFLLSAVIDIGGDWLRAAPPREFVLQGAGPELYAAALLLLGAAVVALLNRQQALALAVPVIVLAALPILQILHYLPYVVAADVHVPDLLLTFEYAIVTWIVLVLVRCVAVAFAPMPPFGWLRAIGGGLLLAAPIWFSGALVPSVPWWRGEGEPAPAGEGGMNAGAEAVLAAQAFLLDHVLQNLQDERPGQADLYFVAFAPDGRSDAWREDAEAAQQVMDSRWGTDGRSVLLVNSPQTLITLPFASVSNLRETLNEIGAIIDPEDDVVMVYLAGRGTPDHGLVAEQPPLALVDLAPGGLKQLLDDADIKWRIVVVSACYSGGFLDPLKDEYTLIVTDARADRATFGCGGRTPAGLFGGAFFTDGLDKGDSLEAAFERAKAAVAERERKAGYAPPADPQMFVGEAMAQKIKTLRSRGTGGITAHRAAPPFRG